MVDILDEVLALKASAKSFRDDGDWEGALTDLQESIDLLLELKADVSPSAASRLDSEFADTYGLIGGIKRRWALELDGEERRRYLETSLAAYDEGFGYERNLRPTDANTYNRVNRLASIVQRS